MPVTTTKTSLLFGCITLISLFACGQNDWTLYEYKDHGFKIRFYQEPELSIDSSTFNNAPLISYFWEVNVDDTLHENNYYSLSVVEYPADFIHSDSLFEVVEGFINSTQKEITEDPVHELLSSSLIEKNGYPGKVFKWKNSSSAMFFEFQIYLVKNKLFQLSTVSRAGQNHNIFINNYFDSFELTDTPRGTFTVPKYEGERTFSIKFPSKPKDEFRTIDSEYGKLNLCLQMYEPKESTDNLVYIAMETKFPAGIVDQNDKYALDSFYKKSIDGSLSSVNGQLISITDIYYNKKPGKEFKCYFSEGKAIMVYRLFLIGDILYTYGVMTYPNKDNNKAMKKFFGSFEILK